MVFGNGSGSRRRPCAVGTRVAFLTVLTVSTVAARDAGQSAAVAGVTRRVLVIPVSFDGSELDVADLHAATFGPTSTSLKTFIETVSSGRVAVTGEVHPTQHLAPNGCDTSQWFTAPEPPVRGYDYYIWVSQHIGAPECDGAAGFAPIGGNRVWINGDDYYRYAIRHEFGHNLGMWHTTNPDPYDTMGGGCDYQAVHKVRLGWLDNVTTVTANGTYDLIASNRSTGTVLRIPNELRGTSYWVEVRDWTNRYVWEGTPCPEAEGVVVREVHDGVLGGDFPPGTNGESTLVYRGTNGFLRAGEAVTLPNSVMQVCVTSLAPGTATVQVSFSGSGICGLTAAKPVLATTPRSPAPAPSTNVTLRGDAPAGSTVTLYANATCSGAPLTSLTRTKLRDPGFTLAASVTTTQVFSAHSSIGGCSDPVTYTVPPTTMPRCSGNVITLEGTVGDDHMFVWTGPTFPDGIEVLFNNDDAFVLAPGGCINKGSHVTSCIVPLDTRIEILTGAGDDHVVVLLEHLAITVDGGTGADVLEARTIVNASRVELRGASGHDRLVAHNGVATLVGDRGNDRLVSGSGAATLDGGPGADVFEQGVLLGADTVIGGRGKDTVTYERRTRRVRVELDGLANDGENSAGERDDIGSDVERIIAGAGNDIVRTRGDSAKNVVEGRGGNDDIKTFGGNDKLLGGDGDDVLNGGPGADVVDGGSGTDAVVNPEPIDRVTGVP